jgi:hypothetical protein
MKHPKIPVNQNKVNLICFLLYNYGSFLESYDGEKESYNIFKMGLEFGLSLLGDINLYTNMFKSKLNGPIYNDIKRYFALNYASITNSESRDSSNLTNTKSIDKSIEHEDLLTRHLRRFKPKKLSLTKHLQINNSPKSKKESSKRILEQAESFEKTSSEESLANSMVSSAGSSITHNDNLPSVTRNEGDRSISIDNYKIEIKGEDNQHDLSVETIVERQEKIILRNPKPDDRKSCTIDNTKKKTSRLKELFSMAAGSSKSVSTVTKRNSINSIPKLMSIFDKTNNWRKSTKTDSAFKPLKSEVSPYHEVMNSIEPDDFHLSSYQKPIADLNEAVKKENYDNFVNNLSETQNIRNITGANDIPPRKKISNILKIEVPEPTKATPPENKNKKDLIINHFGKNLIHESGILEDYITNEVEYKYFELENSSKAFI